MVLRWRTLSARESSAIILLRDVILVNLVFHMCSHCLSMLITSAECEVRICDAQECFKVAFECPEFASECPEVAPELVRDIFEFFDLFLFIILARNIRNIACKSILQKTLKKFGQVASKYERKSTYKSNLRFSLAFYRRNLVFSP